MFKAIYIITVQRQKDKDDLFTVRQVTFNTLKEKEMNETAELFEAWTDSLGSGT